MHVFRTEGGLHQWLWLNAGSAILAFGLPLSTGERALLLMGGVFVLAMECMNTAIERVVDDVSLDQRDLARQAKDAGSAAVALAGVGVGVAWAVTLVGLVR